MTIKSILKKAFWSWEALFVLTTALVMVVFYFLAVPFVELVELKAWDLHFRQRGVVKPSGMVAYVTIDEESLNRDGRWPWPRRQMAQVLKAVEGYGAAVIGLDMGFFEPDSKLRQRAILEVRDRFKAEGAASSSPWLITRLEDLARQEDDDLILASTVKDLSIPLVLGHFFYFDKNSFYPEPPPAEVLNKAACPIVRLVEDPRDGSLNEAVGLETNIPIVGEAARYSGSYNVFADPDGAVRWMPLVVRYEKRLFPSLAFQTLAAAFPELPVMIQADGEGVEDIRLGPVSIPTNNKGEILVNYYGPSYTFPHYSATAILHGEAPQDCLKDRLVLIGITTTGLHDLRPTPFVPDFPGVEIHCTVMENILQQSFLQRSDRLMPYYDVGAVLAIALIFLLLQSLLQGILLGGAVLLLLGGFIATTHYFFLHDGLWLNHIYPSLNLVVAYLGTSAYHFIKEAREKRMIRQTFSLYVPRSVVEEMLAHPELLRLGGDKRELTVLFSDIRGFTTLSEELSPEVLVPQLNEYLTRMTQVVFDHSGTLDKYIGDAIMAIFGAPLAQADHAERACATALDMMKTLDLLHSEWREQGRPMLKIGIGINTGLMMVGNMGSEGRFDYTVLGDNVNLGSRLEGLTKMYGVSIVVSESTWAAAKDRFVGRELDVVRVKGKQTPVPIYEIMARSEDAEKYNEPLQLYQEAMRLFRSGDWREALAGFERMEEHWPGDAPSQIYRERCRELLDQPPGEDWSFVTILDHK